jgi:hypothetical protein
MVTVQEIADEACNRALARLAAKDAGEGRGVITVGEVAFCTMEVLRDHGFLDLELNGEPFRSWSDGS